MNQYLSKKGCRVEDLYEDLRDGVTLIVLLEILSGDKIVSIAPNYMKKKSRNFRNQVVFSAYNRSLSNPQSARRATVPICILAHGHKKQNLRDASCGKLPSPHVLITDC